MEGEEPTSPAVRRLRHLVASCGATAAAVTEIEALFRELVRSGEAGEATGPLRRLCAVAGDVARVRWMLGVALHDAQRHEEALAEMTRAAELALDDPAIRIAVAQLRYETGRPAAEDFAALHGAFPANDGIAGSHAGALAAEGNRDAAETVLVDQLAARPGWIDGHVRLATLRQTGADADFDRGFRSAAAERPRDLALRMAWFHLLAKARRWEETEGVVFAAARDFGEHPAIVAARLFLISEGRLGEDRPDLFHAMPDAGDPGTAICRVRHALRWGRPDEALRVAATFEGAPAEPFFWPYRSLAWRLTDDPRAEWLDRPDRFIATYPLGLDARELAELAETLRGLHTMAAPYLDQSVRGGTQTDRPLLFRHEPIIKRTREAIVAAVRAYADALPAHEDGHPLLGAPRSRLRFAGSWSVRLRAGGHHVSHTHPAGWLSSALYVALPADSGPAPAGWLRLGAPPPDLDLSVGAYRQIEPAAGTLALFPATTWHATAPFGDGERLTLAFDIARPTR